VNITINKRLTGEGRGDIIRPMKSRTQQIIARELARLLQGARVGTLFARQNPCQTGRAILVILHNYFGNILLTFRFSYVIIALLIRWADQFKRGTSYV
jgi:hypothetical protein